MPVAGEQLLRTGDVWRETPNLVRVRVRVRITVTVTVTLLGVADSSVSRWVRVRVKGWE